MKIARMEAKYVIVETSQPKIVNKMQLLSWLQN